MHRKTPPATAVAAAVLALLGSGLIYARAQPPSMEGAVLRYASLERADLRGVNLKGADLSDADLSSADLREADLRAADLSRANLAGADLSGAAFPGRGCRARTWGSPVSKGRIWAARCATATPPGRPGSIRGAPA
jgi:uncharacterized protein YjbI with pentapeptide repeats